MYIMPIMKRTAAKLASMVDSVAWHDSTGMLSALVDQKLVRGPLSIGSSFLLAFREGVLPIYLQG